MKRTINDNGKDRPIYAVLRDRSEEEGDLMETAAYYIVWLEATLVMLKEELRETKG